jgi:hypothetical protein
MQRSPRKNADGATAMRRHEMALSVYASVCVGYAPIQIGPCAAHASASAGVLTMQANDISFESALGERGADPTSGPRPERPRDRRNFCLVIDVE